MLRIALVLAGLTGCSACAGQDVDAFWQATRRQLSREALEARVEPLTDPLPFKTYRVTLRSLGGVAVRARLALPVQGEGGAKPWPVIVSLPGYGGTQQGVMLSECQRGYAILQLYPRAQGESAELWKIDGPDKLTWHVEHPDGAYYQGAYADVMRAIDWAASRSDLDSGRVALVGTSQGGGMALAVAALDPRVKAVVAHLPFLCDMRQAAATPGSLVQRLLDKAGRNDEATLHTLDYFDPLQLAPQLHAPVLLSSGGRDPTCPAATIAAVFARLPGSKTLKTYPELPHTSCVDFYNLSWVWLDQKLRSSP
jgi:cephalosporin-C deacetylase